MKDFIQRYVNWNRVPVGEETSRFARELALDLGANLLSIPSGTDCLTWQMPPQWSVTKGILTGPDGAVLADFHRHPLYLKSYSASFSGTVSLEDLRPHLLSDPSRPERIVYDYRAQYEYGPRHAWGFSLPHRMVENLPAGDYRVAIETQFGPGTLDVVDLALPGRRRETVFFGAHTCHPAMVNDGLACIAVLREVFRWLRERPDRRFTYRLILGPEYFAAAAFLHAARGAEHLRYGFYLDMLGNGQPWCLSHSSQPDSLADRLARRAFHELGLPVREAGYRGVWGNDENFYDGPGLLIPTVGLARDAFDGYHTDADDVAHCDFAQLAEAVEVLKRTILLFEETDLPRITYRGPLYLSRHQLYIDPKKDRQGYLSLQRIQMLLDGTRSCEEIAAEVGATAEFVRAFIGALRERGFVEG